MGNTLSECECVSLADKPVVTEVGYTVLRTSGKKEEGWVISKPIPGAQVPKWVSQHAKKTEGVWRIFMHNNCTDSNSFACGWRNIDKIFPTKIVSEDGIRNWRKCLVDILEDLEERRLEAIRLEAQEPRPMDMSGNLVSF